MRFLFAVAFFLIGFGSANAEIGKMCGGFMGTNCGDSEWCAYSADNVCGISDGTGVCQARPEACIQVFMPVCGCDGTTYSNACVAHHNGSSIAYAGTCRQSESTGGSSKTGASSSSGKLCPQVVSCGTKNGVRKEYPTPCDAEDDGATNIEPKSDVGCLVLQ